MTETMVKVECPSCGRPMGYENNSWRCLACNPIAMNIPICKTQICKQPLTLLEDPWNCWICLKCNKHPKEVNKMQKKQDEKKRVYLDKKVTQDDVAKMVADGIAEAMSKLQPSYPPAEAEITQIAESVLPNAEPVVETYLKKAKRLGVRTHNDGGDGKGGGGMRKKVEIMADIEKLEQPTSIEANEEEEAEEIRKAALYPPTEDDEFARGMTAKDMM